MNVHVLLSHQHFMACSDVTLSGNYKPIAITERSVQCIVHMLLTTQHTDEVTDQQTRHE